MNDMMAALILSALTAINVYRYFETRESHTLAGAVFTFGLLLSL